MKELIAAAALALSAGAAQGAELTLTTTVDTTYCASGGSQCIVVGSGHTAAAAGPTNHNPVRLIVNLTRAGVPVLGLTLASFVFNNNMIPATSSAAVICSDVKCGPSRFQGGAGGTYSIFLDRSAVGNWRSGLYAGSIRVNAGVDTGTTLMSFRIP